MTNQSISIDEILEQNQIIYDIYFSQADSTGSGIIGAYDANNFLKQSKLSSTILKDIWELSDPTGKGYLDRNGFYICLKLVSLAQSNQTLSLENLGAKTPAPKLGDLSSNITSLISPDDAWYIKASSRISYDKIFDSLSPINNKLAGARVKPFLIKSSLSVDILGKIWELSDLDQDGQLDRDEFLIALQLVNKAKEGSQIPDQLPPSLLPFKIRHSSITQTVLQNKPVGLIVNEIKPWVVSVDEKTKSDLTFNQIDTDMDGYVSGAECKDVFLKTGLSSTILANIWALCDIGLSGKLNCEQFALAMHFVNKKLSTGLDPPIELLPEMVPPSLRPKPIVVEEAHASKEFEELQTQVTELQREKLYFEQRANEHDAQTRLKRTELSNLELEMESLYKTLQEREINKSEEQKKLVDYEDKIEKLNKQIIDLKDKYETETSDIEKLRLQIKNLDQAYKTKDSDIVKLKSDLKSVELEQINLESKLSARKIHLTELNTNIQTNQTETTAAKTRIDLLKSIQLNLNKLVKEYDKLQVGSVELSEEIKQIELENQQLQDKLNQITQITNIATEANNIDPFNSPLNTNLSQNEDPFQTYDPFNTVNDPFKANLANQNGHDPFADEFDPFGAKTTKLEEDPFSIKENQIPSITTKSQPPPRPAPPRPQTPSLKPTKKPADQLRPQSAMDFTRNNKLDLFNDFADPFQSVNNKIENVTNGKLDPFGFDWSNLGTNGTKEKDPFDPFA